MLEARGKIPALVERYKTRVRRDPRLADLHDLVANPEEAATVDDGRECSMPYLPISTLVRAASSSVRQRPRRMT